MRMKANSPVYFWNYWTDFFLRFLIICVDFSLLFDGFLSKICILFEGKSSGLQSSGFGLLCFGSSSSAFWTEVHMNKLALLSIYTNLLISSTLLSLWKVLPKMSSLRMECNIAFSWESLFSTQNYLIFQLWKLLWFAISKSMHLFLCPPFLNYECHLICNSCFQRFSSPKLKGAKGRTLSLFVIEGTTLLLCL